MNQSLLLALACILAAPLAAQPAPPAPSPATTPAAAPHADEDTELHDKMYDLRAAYNKLRKQIADPAANASSLALVAKLRLAAEASAALVPERAASVPEADRDKFIEAYKTKMQAFLIEVQKLEAALQAGNNDEAAPLLARLGAMQKEGHKEFQAPKKK